VCVVEHTVLQFPMLLCSLWTFSEFCYYSMNKLTSFLICYDGTFWFDIQISKNLHGSPVWNQLNWFLINSIYEVTAFCFIDSFLRGWDYLCWILNCHLINVGVKVVIINTHRLIIVISLWLILYCTFAISWIISSVTVAEFD
jgi:hypothetical protein